MMARVEGRVVHVLVVSDAPVLREQLKKLLGTRELIAATAVDSRTAARQIELARPDVVLLDLPTTRIDGVSFVRRTMARSPIAIVVCADLVETGDAALRALDEGALEVVTKP